MQLSPRQSAASGRWRALGPAGKGMVAGTALAAALMLLLALMLLTGPGATWRILLPALLMLLPVLGLGAGLGFVGGALAASARRPRR